MKFYYKIHESQAGYLLAACDASICGKKLAEGDLEFFVNPRFYKDKQASSAQIKKQFAVSSSANIVGKNIVQLAKDLGLIKKENIVIVAGIPHAQLVVVKL
jgi:uncharacterized protein